MQFAVIGRDLFINVNIAGGIAVLFFIRGVWGLGMIREAVVVAGQSPEVIQRLIVGVLLDVRLCDG